MNLWMPCTDCGALENKPCARYCKPTPIPKRSKR